MGFQKEVNTIMRVFNKLMCITSHTRMNNTHPILPSSIRKMDQKNRTMLQVVEGMHQKHWLDIIPIGIDSSIMNVVSFSVCSKTWKRLYLPPPSFGTKLHVLGIPTRHEFRDGMVGHALFVIVPGQHHRGDGYWV